VVYLIRHDTGDLDKARDACGRALALEKQIDNVAPQTFIAGKLAAIERADGKLDAAEAKYIEAIGIAKNLSLQQAALQRGLGGVYFEDGKYLLAIAAFQAPWRSTRS
jgi:tetratricopeptide (TPR) repeat protein